MTERLFPLGMPPATQFYLSLYLVTWIAHVLFVSYVVAGTAYLVFESMKPRGPMAGTKGESLGLVLADWMPFALSAAITLGVAPLLFLQVLYQHAFYTANLLLSHRWMAILPALIAGFYLVYLLRSPAAREWRPAPRSLVGLAAFACFLFTGWSWTENHLLSQDPAAWPSLYESGSMCYRNPQALPRALFWLASAVPTMLAMAGWQLYWYAGRRGRPAPPSEARRAALHALVGLIATVALGGFYVAATGGALRAEVLGLRAGPYVMIGLVGVVLEVLGWWAMLRSSSFTEHGLSMASVGGLTRLLGTAVVRECLRLSSADFASLAPRHEAAMQAGGLAVFLVFALLGALAIVWCFQTVRKGARDS